MKSFAFGLGVVVAFIGLTTEVGYALKIVQLYNWGDGTGMAINTGFAFLLSGIAVCILASRSHPQLCQKRPKP